MAPDAPTPRPGAPDERGRSATDLRLAAAIVAGGSLLVLVIAALGARSSTARQAPPTPRATVPASDSALADSLATQGGALMEARAWKDAERAFEQALALHPANAHLRARYARLLMLTRRPIPALRELEQARALDSLDVRVNLDVGWGHYFAKEHVRAINAFQRALRLDSRAWEGHDGIGRALVQMRRGAAAIERLRRAVDLGAGARTQAHLAHALALFGYVEEARAMERTLVTRAASARAAAPVDVAVMALGFGDVDRAFALLTEAEAARVPGLAVVTVDPVFTPLFDDPRFDMFLERLNLAPPPPNEFKKGTPIPR